MVSQLCQKGLSFLAQQVVNFLLHQTSQKHWLYRWCLPWNSDVQSRYGLWARKAAFILLKTFIFANKLLPRATYDAQYCGKRKIIAIVFQLDDEESQDTSRPAFQRSLEIYRIISGLALLPEAEFPPGPSEWRRICLASAASKMLCLRRLKCSMSAR